MFAAAAAVQDEVADAPSVAKPRFAPWTSDREVPALLARCITEPPLCQRIRVIFPLTVDERRVFCGDAPNQLRAIRQRYGQAALSHLRRTGDEGPFRAWSFDHPEVTDIIDDALVAADVTVTEVVVTR